MLNRILARSACDHYGRAVNCVGFAACVCSPVHTLIGRLINRVALRSGVICARPKASVCIWSKGCSITKGRERGALTLWCNMYVDAKQDVEVVSCRAMKRVGGRRRVGRGSKQQRHNGGRHVTPRARETEGVSIGFGAGKSTVCG